MKEILKEKLEEISKLREHKGKEEETLGKIKDLETEAEKEGDQELLAKLNWERSLIWQHIVMNEKSNSIPDEIVTKNAINKMASAALKAHKIIEENNLNKLLATSYRFLGRTYTYKNDHEKAKEMYLKAIEIIKNEEGNNQILELNGFLAPTLLMTEDEKGGIDLALKTFKHYETSKIGKKLKEKGYYVWAVWRSGLISRMIFAMKEVEVSIDKNMWNNLLNDCEKSLSNPEGEIWGDFQFRIDEIKNARKLLNS